jgi:subtilase family serine protease
MKILKTNSWVVLCAVVLLLVGQAAWAQQVTVPARVVEAVDDTQTVTLQGNVHPFARAANDQGALPDSQPMTRMLLLLQRSDTQEASLRQLLDAQQTKGSGSYHAWLTPEQFGKQYGPADADVQAVTDWLQSHGFQNVMVGAGRTTIEFSGNVGQVRNAFHTQIHKYLVKGEEHFANASDPAIPEALSPVVKGVVALHNFPKQAHVKSRGMYRRTKATGELKPLFTYGSPANYALGPGDWDVIYSVPSTATGAGQAIAIVGQSNINITDVENFRSIFGLPVNDPQIIVNGTDPGIVGPNVTSCAGSSDDEGESDLDVEWAGAIAPLATIYLVTSESTCSNPTQVSEGIDLSALYIVDNNLAPVMSESYGGCEPSLGTTGNQFYNAMWEQAAAEGITVVVSTGDTGSAGCDSPATEDAATLGLAVSGIASTPFNVSTGGTDFDPSAEPVTPPNQYWGATNNANQTSALMYIPETTWDNSACAAEYPAACNSVDTTSYVADLSAGGGGPSNCATLNGAGTACTAGYPKPAYQVGLTTTDAVRDIPDISFFSSNGGPITGGSGVAIVVCQSDANLSGAATCDLNSPYEDFSLVGGTSSAAPTFAAVMALVNQATGDRQGNANYVLYGLAAADTTNYKTGNCNSSVGHTPAAGCVYNDVTKGNNGVACVKGSQSVIDGDTTWCQGSGSTYGVTIASGAVAYGSGSQYDLATGLGSINVGNLLTKWSTVSRPATTTNLSSPSGGTPSGQNFTATITVSPAPGTGTGENVSLIALASDTTTVLGSYGPFALTASGTATAATNLLPPGTAYVEGSYGGDAAHAASTSAPVALPAGVVAGSGQTSTVTLYYFGFDANGNPTTPTTSPQNFVYGSGNGYMLKIVVTGSSGSCSFSVPSTKPAFPCPTGQITLTNNGSALNDFLSNGVATNKTSLNNQGFAEDQPINVNVGTNSIQATYLGDQNYAGPITSNTLVLTVTQASTTTQVASSLSSVTSGASVTLTAAVSTTGFGVAPCGITNSGTVAFTSNGAALSGTVAYTPFAPTQTTPAYCTATLTTAISGLYPPGMVRPGPPSVPVVPMIVALLSLLVFLLGFRWLPEGRRRAYAYAGLMAFALLVVGIVGCGGGSGGGGGGGGGGTTVTIKAAYSGDTDYAASSGSTSITVN